MPIPQRYLFVHRPVPRLAPVAVMLLLALGLSCRADAANCDWETDPDCPSPAQRTVSAVGAYASSPLHWDARDWLLAGGAAAALAIAHHYDGPVRSHFYRPGDDGSGGGKSAVLPAAALLLGTWGAAEWEHDHDGVREAHAMIEATALSLGTAWIGKQIAGRRRPYETADVNDWRAGGGSFPSFHATAAFAIGAVMAEAGSDEYRWLRRTLGYGVGAWTAYERVHHSDHWLSDTVAGAVLGAASARFALHRAEHPTDEQASIGIEPLADGLALGFQAHWH